MRTPGGGSNPNFSLQRPAPRVAPATRAIFPCSVIEFSWDNVIGGLAPAVPCHVLGIPARFIPHAASPDHILAQLGLDADGIAHTIRDRC